MNRPEENIPRIEARLDALLASRPARARAGFSDRVMRRIATGHSETIDAHLDALLQERPVAASGGFTAGVWRRIRRAGAHARRRVWMRTAAAAAAMALAVGVAMEGFRGTDSHRPEGSAVAGESASPAIAHRDYRQTGLSEDTLMFELILLSEGLEGAEPLLEDESLHALALMSR